MSWFTENPWPLVLLLISAAVIGVVLQLRRCWQLAAGLLLSAAAVYVLETQIVTVSEQLEQRLDGIRLAFVHDDLAQIRSFISPDNPDLVSQAEDGLKLVQVSAGLHLKEVQVQVEAGDQRATVQLRANGNVTQRDSGQPMYIATRWRTTWERGEGTWLLRDVQRLDPVSGQSIGVFSAGP
ncbi:MAG: hypothetical protein ACK5FF_10645 [Planctomyces sp.]